jgi:parvulin-like peptidyl-prolyl isomerase
MKWIFKILAALALLAAAAAGFSLLFGNDADTQYVTIYDDADGADN